MGARSVLLLTVLLVGCVAPDPATVDTVEQALAGFTMTSPHCDEVLVWASVPAASARAFVPASFAILGEATGRATVLAGLKVCDDVELDGVDVGTASTSDVGVVVASPDGSDGFHYYQTWWHTDHPVLRMRLVALGFDAGLDTVARLDDGRTAGVGAAAAEVDAGDGAYAISAMLASAPAAPEVLAVGWTEGPTGVARVVKTLAGNEQGTGPGRIVAEGSMADLLGAASSDGLGLWGSYALDSVVERVEG